ncbi:serine/threonine protein kinase, variant [Aphanomyces invadans]|uniref:mitogen-activated protein kinase kinase n=1 Tax=Aphanomyces invadans TaxID=157072 RepID=A0A024U4Q5_9STRA|nr:serine/threonine protein kinase, variant [Aphanomyces invadans]ETW00598.1 serine/threonine protein kinase, variant [Aphanomyces invadans]|eukprot:XP_008870733.1 serine/threonine protein kinase, variant [Aphanomyces invadans]
MDQRKRNRFESMNDESYVKKAEGGLPMASRRKQHQQRRHLQRALSLPNIQLQMERKPEPPSIFPDVDVRSLRLAEVRSWARPWVKTADTSPPKPHAATNPSAASPTKIPHILEKRLDDAIEAIRIELNLDDDGVTATDRSDTGAAKVAPSTFILPSSCVELSSASLRKEGGTGLTIVSTATPTSSSVATTISPHTPSPLPLAALSTPKKRFSLRLQLDDMPTPQQAENRANRAANRLLAHREAMDPNDTGPVSGMQRAMIAFRASSGQLSDNDLNSPHDGGELGRFSHGSSYSPNHGRFTTQNVSVSEAGIASPDSSCLHLQENVVRVKEVGRGASGVVYKAVHLPTLKVVAIKEIPVYGKNQRRQMVRELHALYANLVPLDENKSKARGAIRLPSPYIVSFYDAFVDKQKNCISLVMEYMGVGSLQDIVVKSGGRGIPEILVARIATSVLEGLKHIHGNRMVHRDIKPHNLLMNHQGQIKISDFGLARTLNDNATQTKTFVGTLLYMAPERIGGGDYAYPADIWSFGLVLVSVALGRYPLPTHDGFFGLVDSVANEGYLKLPDEFSDVCRDFMDKCLAIDPEDRWTAEQLLRHPFLVQNPPATTLAPWKKFIDTICEPRLQELDDIAEAVYGHIYENIHNCTTTTPQSDYGMSMLSDTPRHILSLPPVERSLQLGLSKYLDLPASVVYDKFEEVVCRHFG